jgi:hypothetical protein
LLDSPIQRQGVCLAAGLRHPCIHGDHLWIVPNRRLVASNPVFQIDEIFGDLGKLRVGYGEMEGLIET